MKYEMYENMYRTDSVHWWFRAKREIVMALSMPVLSRGAGKKSIIDFGCGCGMMLNELSPYGEVTGADFSEVAISYCGRRFQGDLRQMDLSVPVKPWNQYDFGIALDILEHIEDDLIAAENLYRFIRPGGSCVITVPAYQWLYSSHDKNCMHKRRYSKTTFKAVLEKAGFQVKYLSYYNTLLFPPAALVRLLSKLIPFDRSSSVENSVRESLLNTLLYRIFRMEKSWLSKGRTFPFGLSLIALAQRPV